MVIRKIFEGNFDDEVHNDFLKFGRGEYKDRYLIEAKNTSNGFVVKTSYEYVNSLVKKCLTLLSKKTRISGVIVSTFDLKKEANFEIKKTSNFQGVRKSEIDSEISPEDLLNLMNKYPRVFYALSFEGDDFSIKVKPKAPKSGKPGKESSEDSKADFCTLKTKNKEIIKDLFFDVQDFKEACISHSIIINEIVYPKNASELKPEQIREQSKRKGIIYRKALIDGKEVKTQAEFLA